MKNKVFIGFDTSNYTTSAAVVSYDGRVLCNFKKLLFVNEGERGLRQSDAVFRHTTNLPEITGALRTVLAELSEYEICAVGYSAYPRDKEGSYMPCFLVGQGAALAGAALSGAPAYAFSHQAGHIMAALYSAGATHLIGKEFFAFHVSGGTTDVLHIKEFKNGTFNIEKIGGTLDVNAGQVIDRVGVYMGLSFPAGALLEKLSLKNREKVPKYIQSVRGAECNLSGIENKACALYDKTKNKALTAAYTFSAVEGALSAMSEYISEKYPSAPIVYAGGVMSAFSFRKKLSQYSEYFAAPEFSSDNAAGTALLARLAYEKDGSVINGK